VSSQPSSTAISRNTSTSCYRGILEAEATLTKGQRTKALICAIAELASHNPVLDVSVPRPRSFPSKYEEAQALAKGYPELLGYLPKHRRRIFDFEPRSMVLFEALALADAVIKGPPTTLAAAMG